MTHLQTSRTELVARRRVLMQTMSRLPSRQIGDPTISQANRAAASRELRRLQRAIARVDAGSYGVCMQCGERISADRLRQDPSTALCTSCKGVG